MRAATVATLEPTELLRIDRADFQRVTKVGRKAADREKNADGEEWGERAKALHAAAFAGDILGVERALEPENHARITGIKEKRRMVWAQKQLTQLGGSVPTLEAALLVQRRKLDEVVDTEAKAGRQARLCEESAAKADSKLQRLKAQVRKPPQNTRAHCMLIAL